MPNINKVVYGDTTLIDLTNSTLNSPDQILEGTTAYDRSGTLLTGTASPSVDLPIITTESPDAVGTAVVDEAETGTPNYTPSGDIRLTTTNTNVVTGASLNYSYNNYKLTISGITPTTGTVAIPTGATFVGNGVNLINVYEESD